MPSPHRLQDAADKLCSSGQVNPPLNRTKLSSPPSSQCADFRQDACSQSFAAMSVCCSVVSSTAHKHSVNAHLQAHSAARAQALLGSLLPGLAPDMLPVFAEVCKAAS